MRVESEEKRRFAPATARNREPILAVLEEELPRHGSLLEVASGTGEHTAFFAGHFPGLTWTPSDADARSLESIEAWRRHAGLPNVQEARLLDVETASWGLDGLDAVMCINMIHIAPWSACEGLMRGASQALRQGGVLFLYGPYMLEGVHTAVSNEKFDRWLRAREPSWGVRDLTEVCTMASSYGLQFSKKVAMPANNFSVILRRE